jgi:hypothetical protein
MEHQDVHLQFHQSLYKIKWTLKMMIWELKSVEEQVDFNISMSLACVFMQTFFVNIVFVISGV